MGRVCNTYYAGHGQAIVPFGRKLPNLINAVLCGGVPVCVVLRRRSVRRQCGRVLERVTLLWECGEV